MKSTKLNNKWFSRRDIIKLASVLPLAYLAAPLIRLIEEKGEQKKPNIIILVFDACSAENVSLYGYERETTPNLTRFAEKASVYHNHYSCGTFTVPGTSSLLTGLYPWTHRAMHLGAGITRQHSNHHMFAALRPTHSTLAYGQNRYADLLLSQADKYLDTHLRSGLFNIQNKSIYTLFKNDARIAFASFEDNIIRYNSGYGASAFLGPVYRLGTLYDRLLLTDIYQDEYPLGMPDSTELFLLKDVVDNSIAVLKNLAEPGLVYMHYFPPHHPYHPKTEFLYKFEDGWKPKTKEIHPLSLEKRESKALLNNRQLYDEYLASWDDEIGRLFEFLENSGLLDNSYVIITSDHGELFERGELGHFSKLIYEPLIHVPLIISQPGQTDRHDYYTNTSNLDLLPTVAHITGNPIPDWVEGEILPGFGGAENKSRSIYVTDAKENSSFAPLTRFSATLTKDRHRLTYYSYSNYQQFEFYNLDDDPDEIDNLFPSEPLIAISMKEELLEKLAEKNRPFEHK